MRMTTEMAFSIFAIGAAMLYVEFAFPRLAQFNPLVQIPKIRFEASRMARIFIAITCMYFPLRAERVISGTADDWLMIFWRIGLVIALVHDLFLYAINRLPPRIDDEPKTPKRQKKNRR